MAVWQRKSKEVESTRENKSTIREKLRGLHPPKHSFQKPPLVFVFTYFRKKFIEKLGVSKILFDLHLFSGNNFNKRLGHGDGPNLSAPKRVDALQGEHVIMSVTWMYDHGNLRYPPPQSYLAQEIRPY